MNPSLPDGFRSDFVTCGEVRLHVVHNGAAYQDKPVKDQREAIVFLHGFPEFWPAWQEVFTRLSDEYWVIAPDQRGYNLSDAPKGVENYRAHQLILDIDELANRLIGEGRPYHVAGHDWGASIAYGLAIQFPQKIRKLIIANGVHPASFQQALIDSAEQAKASQYFHVLRDPDAATLMAEDNYRRLFSMFEKFSTTPWLDDEMRSAYREAWSRPDRLEAMLHWYNSSPIVVPKPGEAVTEAPLYNVASDKLRVPMPHLLVWGLGDQALRPETRKRLPEFCDDLEPVEIADGDHWLLHTHGAKIAGEVRRFLAA